MFADLTESFPRFELHVQKKLDDAAAALEKAKRDIAGTDGERVVSSFPIDDLIKSQGEVIAWATTKELIENIKSAGGSVEETFDQLLKTVTRQVVSTSWASSSSNVDVEFKLSTHRAWVNVLEEMGWVK